MFKQKLRLGRLIVTAEINNQIIENPSFARFIQESIAKQSQADWGDTNPHDKLLNDESLEKGDTRILSSFNIPANLAIADGYGQPQDKVWIITEADRSQTTALFPSNY